MSHNPLRRQYFKQQATDKVYRLRERMSRGKAEEEREEDTLLLVIKHTIYTVRK